MQTMQAREESVERAIAMIMHDLSERLALPHGTDMSPLHGVLLTINRNFLQLELAAEAALNLMQLGRTGEAIAVLKDGLGHK